ncbi:MAG: DUF4846 domain-containing protein [Phycisphaerae bacterium]|nr:DUF4846 domain-containing protein [Saprospiraceae bacterium]
MKKPPLFLLALSLFAGLFCSNGKNSGQRLPEVKEIYSHDSLLVQRFAPPNDFKRSSVDTGSFAHFLRYLPLKPSGSKVRYFNGVEKENLSVYDAVVDLPIGRKDLHQCADAVIRLRAEYLWHRRQFDKISFHFTNGFPVEYNRWRKGGRVKVRQNEVYWVENAANPSNSYDTFWAYLEMIFSYAGTLSLSKELHPKTITELQIGDVFIRGGSPGHAVIVVDVAKNADGQTVFLLAQSYMPAQEIQVLKNPNDPKLSPWYSANIGENLITPEWTFGKEDLKAF